MGSSLASPQCQMHAQVQIGEFKVPLIGIPPSAVLESCDCCHDDIGLSEAVFTGSQVLCPKCCEEPKADHPNEVNQCTTGR